MNDINWNYLIIGVVVIILLIVLYKYMYGGAKKSIDVDDHMSMDQMTYYKMDDNFVTVVVPTLPQYIGSQIIVKTPKNTYFHTHEDPTDNNITFNLYDENMIEHVIVRTTHGDDHIYNYPEINKIIKVETKLEQLEKEIMQLQQRISESHN